MTLQRIVAAAPDASESSLAAAGAKALAGATGASLQLITGEQYHRLLTETRSLDADLLVISPASGAALSQTDWQIVRNSSCPVLLTRGGAEAGYRELLVAVDPMHEHDRPAALDDELIGIAAGVASAYSARLRLLHCYLPSQYVPFRAPGAISAAVAHGGTGSLEAHGKALQQLAARHGIAGASALLEPADPRDGIPDVASRLDIDLVVMGAVARNRLRRLLIGSTAEPVLSRLSCDVLVTKPSSAV